MSNAGYPLTLADALSAIFPNTPTIQALGSGYTYSSAHHFESDLSSKKGSPTALTTVAFTGGVLTADPPTITGLSGGDVIVAFAIYNDTGVAGTSKLVAFIDTDSTGAAISHTSDGTNLDLFFPGVTILSV